MPAIPPPRITTDLPTPTFAGQSPGRGDTIRPCGGGGAGGFVGAPGAADEDPQALSDVPMPIAIIVRSIAELPTARPIEVRKSRLAMLVFFEVIFLSNDRRPTHYKPGIAAEAAPTVPYRIIEAPSSCP